MAEFLGEVTRDHMVDRETARQLAWLRWICIRGTYVFATRDPALRAEQRRYTELCGCLSAAFAVIVDDPELQDLCGLVFGPNRVWSNGDPKCPAQAEALIENWLQGGKNWEHSASPIGWVHQVAKNIHNKNRPIAMDMERNVWSLDAPTPTIDTYAALLPERDGASLLPPEREVSGRDLISTIDSVVDLNIACERERLAPETSLLARGRYDLVPRSVAAEVLGLSEQNVDAASRELRTAMPALRARLAFYRGKPKPQVKQL